MVGSDTLYPAMPDELAGASEPDSDSLLTPVTSNSAMSFASFLGGLKHPALSNQRPGSFGPVGRC